MDIHQFVVMTPVTTPEEAEQLRGIRNECKNFMTRDTGYIMEDQQQRWFKNLSSDIKIYLLHLVEHGVVSSSIGYGLIREEDGYSLISGGLLEQYRGKGFGTILFQYLLKNVNQELPIRLEVLKNNTKAFLVYNKLGFRVYSDDGKVIKMEYVYDSSI